MKNSFLPREGVYGNIHGRIKNLFSPKHHICIISWTTTIYFIVYFWLRHCTYEVDNITALHSSLDCDHD